jgi:small neutral amino acid transporter SnatA (MarC family)
MFDLILDLPIGESAWKIIVNFIILSHAIIGAPLISRLFTYDLLTEKENLKFLVITSSITQILFLFFGFEIINLYEISISSMQIVGAAIMATLSIICIFDIKIKSKTSQILSIILFSNPILLNYISSIYNSGNSTNQKFSIMATLLIGAIFANMAIILILQTMKIFKKSINNIISFICGLILLFYSSQIFFNGINGVLISQSANIFESVSGVDNEN